jgi:trans-aconitate methyltransferase
MPAEKLYSELADWWYLLSPPSDYDVEAEYTHQLLDLACDRPPHTLLELGCGGGNNAFHLKKHYALTLTDLSPHMLANSRTLNSECEHIQGDMRSLRLERAFDAVFIHDAICYMTTETDLLAAMTTAFVHCRPGGAAVFMPDHTRETYKSEVTSGGQDGPQRGLRYLEWEYDPDPKDTQTMCDFAYLLHEADGTTRVVHDRHIFGLFPRRAWLRLLKKAGFDPYRIHDPFARDVFVAKKPGIA